MTLIEKETHLPNLHLYHLWDSSHLFSIFQGDGVFFLLPKPTDFPHRLLLDARWARRGAKARNLREKLSTWCPGFGCKKIVRFFRKGV